MFSKTSNVKSFVVSLLNKFQNFIMIRYIVPEIWIKFWRNLSAFLSALGRLLRSFHVQGGTFEGFSYLQAQTCIFYILDQETKIKPFSRRPSVCLQGAYRESFPPNIQPDRTKLKPNVILETFLYHGIGLNRRGLFLVLYTRPEWTRSREIRNYITSNVELLQLIRNQLEVTYLDFQQIYEQTTNYEDSKWVFHSYEI